MTDAALIALVDRLRAEPVEVEWLEFKATRVTPDEFGEYVSALANGAALARQSFGYLVLGIEDASHRVVGTTYNPRTEKIKTTQDLLHYTARMLNPRVRVEVFDVAHPQGRIVLVRIEAATDQPVRYSGIAYVRVNEVKTRLAEHPSLEKALWHLSTDWSAEIVEGATLADLDPEALSKARAQFAEKHPKQRAQIPGWDEITFLRKAKLARRDSLTRAALLLLGKEEAAHFLSPADPRISWFLKDAGGQDLDYEHFFPPFILRVDDVLAHIRNLTLRVMPEGTMFPKEVQQYDTEVIREGLHNALAHQDYTARSRVNVVEFPDRLLITNRGSFLAGTVEQVIERNAPPDAYRNLYLSSAMVALNMIDTQGGGI